MRTTLRTTMAFLASVVVLSVSAIAAGASDPAPLPMPAEDGGAAAGACLEGTTDCDDAPGVVDGGGMAMCVEGVPDCDDMVVVPDDGQTEPGDPGTGGGVPGDPGTVLPCGEEIVEGEGPDATVSYTPCDTGEPPAPTEPVLTEPQPGTTNTYARPFDTATVAGDDVTVTIDFVSGIEPCYVLDRVDVDFGRDAVTITLFEGSDADAGQVACIEDRRLQADRRSRSISRSPAATSWTAPRNRTFPWLLPRRPGGPAPRGRPRRINLSAAPRPPRWKPRGIRAARTHPARASKPAGSPDRPRRCAPRSRAR